MIFTDDPLSDFDRYDRQQEEWLNSLPVCDCCGGGGGGGGADTGRFLL